MRRRTLTQLFVQSSLLGALSMAACYGPIDSRVMAQDPKAPAAQPALKRKEAKLKEQKEIGERATEKNKVKMGKSEKADMSPLDLYYNDYLIPMLTDPTAESINMARREILDDIDSIEKNKDLSAKFNAKFILQMRELAFKGSDGRVYSPPTRLNAAILLCRLNEFVNSDGSAKPELKVLGSIKDLLEQKENDGLLSIGLNGLTRHLKANADSKSNTMSDEVRTRFCQILQTHLTAPAPLQRTPESNNYLTEQLIECMTEIAKFDREKGAAKLAATALSPVLVKVIEDQESEWLVEKALLSLGSIKTVGLTPEDAIKLEKAIAKFTRQSIIDWRKRVKNSGPSVGGLAGGGYSGGGEMGGYGEGGMSPGGMGGSGDGYGGGAAGGKGGSGGGGKGGGGSGEGGYGMTPGGSAPKKTNPYDIQPKEVRNARRIAHQRFERIHCALNGALNDGSGSTRTKATSTPAPMTPLKPAVATEEKALIALISSDAKEKANVIALLSKVEQFQKDLNSEKIADLTSLSRVVLKSGSEIKAACNTITGDKVEEVVSDVDELELSSK